MNKLLRFLSFSVFLAASYAANATIITVNGVDVEALDLSGSYSSFEDFYSYNDANAFSSDTGLEKANTIVMYFAELNGELALFTTVSGTGGKSGTSTIDINGSAGSLTFVDDNPEFVSSNNIIWNYGGGAGDGLIYSDLGTSGGWSLDLSFTDLVNITGLDFLTFVDGLYSGVTEAISSTNTVYSVTTTSVDEPLSLSLLSLFLVGLTLTKRKR